MQQGLWEEAAQEGALPNGRAQARCGSTLEVLRQMRLLQVETCLSLSSTPSGTQPELRADRAAHYCNAMTILHLACRLAKKQYLSLRNTKSRRCTENVEHLEQLPNLNEIGAAVGQGKEKDAGVVQCGQAGAVVLQHGLQQGG